MKLYEEKAAQMQRDEINENFCCKNGAPLKVSKYGGILSHAASVYNLILFKILEEAFNLGLGLNCVETNHHENSFSYSLTKGVGKRLNIVQFNQLS